jgi:hypothetical protein
MRLRFGLEKRTKVNLIEVHWPSGIIDKVADTAVNKVLTIKEGQGLVDQKDFRNGAPPLRNRER